MIVSNIFDEILDGVSVYVWNTAIFPIKKLGLSLTLI